MNTPDTLLDSHQTALTHIVEQLDKYDLTLALTRKQQMPRRHELVQSLVEKQQLGKIEQKLKRLHPADIAYVLEGLPLERRKLVWSLVLPAQHGAVLLEVADAVRESLLADMNRNDILGAAQQLDSDEIADLAPDLPSDIVSELLISLEHANRTQVQALLAFPENTVGALMDFEMVRVRDDIDVDVVLRYLRRLGSLPDNLNQLFVVDRQGVLQGVLPLKSVLVNNADTPIKTIMNTLPRVFQTSDSARDAALAFERYGLLSAAVVNAHGQLMGNLGAEAVMDYMQQRSQQALLGQAGLPEDEDLFAPVWKSSRNRWPWLGLNLLTAFASAIIISLFEDTISQLVALAVLMPIIANIGGNCGNQTVALMIRGLALKQITPDSFRRLIGKELGISIINGVLWGSVVALFSLIFYHDLALALVLQAAMVLTLLIAALCGLFLPLLLQKLGRDPVMGSTILVTAVTDGLGFFIFLGLASIVLL